MAKKPVKRREWTDQEKMAIVAEANEPGTKKTEVVKRHGITSGMLWKWEKKFGVGDVVDVTAASPTREAKPTDRRVIELAIRGIDAEIERLQREREELRNRLG